MEAWQKLGYTQGARDALECVEYAIDHRMDLAEVRLFLTAYRSEVELWETRDDPAVPTGYRLLDEFLGNKKRQQK
jgi:hypothetical protein